VTGSANYVQSVQDGVVGGNGGSAFGQLTRIPRSYDLTGEQYTDANGQSRYFNTAIVNPYWSVNNSLERGQTDRFFGSFTVSKDITKWLNVLYRATGDTYIDRRKFTEAIGSARTPLGSVAQNNFYQAELNGDLIIANQKDNNLVEITRSGHLVGTKTVDPAVVNPATGANSGLFGLAAVEDGSGHLNVYFTDDNTNTVGLLAP